MQFLLLLYGDEVADAEMSEAQAGAVIEEHGVFSAKLRSADAHVFGVAVAESAMATTLTRDAGPPGVANSPQGGGAADEIVTDGPFAEGREQMGGLYVIECADLDEALSWARQVPWSNKLKVEIRPVLEL